ncbi:OLC1v1021391C1 [Oldenlandia corymbosa var. corymbosa]|uniref:OLC1v1021391C1 n=1 Tax=Oldenlandia corymbosa var. corymbosa TaxID=529605 RepID=A0AAV1BVJ5_OLDCO|nr:OLC1v1021391C1 [Oldenlandia corymbosa var. corymbosa]
MPRKRGRGGGGSRGGGGGKGRSNREKFRGIEENTLAILENSSTATSHHLLDDRLAFLQAVRSASLVPENGTAPTNKMLEAVFRILKDEDSLDLIVESYELLLELNKRYPRVSLSLEVKSGSCPESEALSKLIVVEEAWCPFRRSEKEESSSSNGELIDSSSFHSLIEDIAEITSSRSCKEEMSRRASEESCRKLDLKSLRNMLLFHYLVSILEGDFIARTQAFKENMNWALLRESILNVILGSRKTSYKDLIKECLSLMCDLCRGLTEFAHDLRPNGSLAAELRNNIYFAVQLTLPEVETRTCNALKKLLLMIMDLDSSRNLADMSDLISRADGVRTPAAEIILNELTYDGDILSPFFLAVDEPDWKLKLVVQFFQKYIPKSSARTRRSNGSASDVTFDGILKCFSNQSISKGVNKKIRAEVTQLLLAHAFKAYLSIASNQSAEDISGTKQDTGAGCLVEICRNIISAFACLQKDNKRCELLEISKEALFTAGTIIAMNPTGISH